MAIRSVVIVVSQSIITLVHFLLSITRTRLDVQPRTPRRVTIPTVHEPTETTTGQDLSVHSPLSAVEQTERFRSTTSCTVVTHTSNGSCFRISRVGPSTTLAVKVCTRRIGINRRSVKLEIVALRREGSRDGSRHSVVRCTYLNINPEGNLIAGRYDPVVTDFKGISGTPHRFPPLSPVDPIRDLSISTSSTSPSFAQVPSTRYQVLLFITLHSN